jgi:hypothetical protein
MPTHQEWRESEWNWRNNPGWMIVKMEGFRDRDQDSIGASESSKTSFRSAVVKISRKRVPLVSIGVGHGSLEVVGGPRGQVLEVPARVFGSCWL